MIYLIALLLTIIALFAFWLIIKIGLWGLDHAFKLTLIIIWLVLIIGLYYVILMFL